MPRKHGEYASVRECILAVSARLFAETGVRGASLNDIADAAQLAKGTLYYYYPAKDNLVLEVAGINAAAFTDDVFLWVSTLSRESSLHDSAEKLVVALCSDVQRMRLHAVLCAEASSSNPALSALLINAYHEWTVMLELGILKLQAMPDVHMRSQLFFACLDGFMLQSPASLTELDTSMLVNVLCGG